MKKMDDQDEHFDVEFFFKELSSASNFDMQKILSILKECPKNLFNRTASKKICFFLEYQERKNREEVICILYNNRTYDINVYSGNFIIFDAYDFLEENLDFCISLKSTNRSLNMAVNIRRKIIGIDTLFVSEDIKVRILQAEALFIENLCSYTDYKIIGHRGDGARDFKKTFKNIRKSSVVSAKVGNSLYFENTITSILSAKSQGATWVEFDVQVTKDYVPVLFHNFLINEDLMEGYIHEMTHHEFLGYFNNYNNEYPNLPCTLEHLLSYLDEDIGLNIEIKYPLEQEMSNYHIKDLIPLDKYVDVIINTIIKSNRKKVILSSFNPYIIILLKLRLPEFPIYFITEKKVTFRKDVHTNSLYEALSFALKLNLKGIVVDYKSICNDVSNIIAIFKNFDLNVFVYGSEVSNRLIYENLLKVGVDGVIADNISELKNI